jgi:thiol-disulfide isomerase/thioredoxin
MTRRIPLCTALLALLLALTAAGCGSSTQSDGRHPDYARALAGSPPQLAALYKQANEILPGGKDAYEKRIAALKGYPVVANVWASWCGPCRFEFPVLQKLAARYGRQVAFVGINSEDSTDEASRFLREEPVPYPSYSDPGKDIAESIGAGGYPDTAFYDKSGKLCHLKIGAYADDSELEEDVRTFAVRGRCENG